MGSQSYYTGYEVKKHGGCIYFERNVKGYTKGFMIIILHERVGGFLDDTNERRSRIRIAFSK